MSSAVGFMSEVGGYQAKTMEAVATLDCPDKPPAHKSEPASSSFIETIVGRRGSLRQILSHVKAVAPTNATVMITGETGTGKEVIARAIHEFSPRRNRNLVKVNCAAMPAGLLESELFGHERGAFTGAINMHVGRFALADRGTLFLDEIGDMPLELQPKLLRVLQEREFEPVGSTRTTRVDVRVIAATNRDLRHMVLDKEFREDLYYRLNIFPIYLPPLRERESDIPELVNYFVRHYAESMGKRIESIPEETMRVLVRHPWPGNIRELQNYIARAVILSSDGIFESLPLEQFESSAAEEIANPTLEDKVRQEIIDSCRHANWKLGGPRGAAARLGLKRTTLSNKMRRLGIERPPVEETAEPTLEDKVRQEILAACRRANWKLGGPRGAAARLGLKRTTLFYRMRTLGIRRPEFHPQHLHHNSR